MYCSLLIHYSSEEHKKWQRFANMVCYLYYIDYIMLDTYLQWWNKMEKNGEGGGKLLLKHHS